ncbi:hypothetical protein ASE07_26500 [Noviherbaspirillum sp. Root189]|nr:hypothetical protein ASE07_26500 [Noviherbaspirillum sp. Root189]
MEGSGFARNLPTREAHYRGPSFVPTERMYLQRGRIPSAVKRAGLVVISTKQALNLMDRYRFEAHQINACNDNLAMQGQLNVEDVSPTPTYVYVLNKVGRSVILD